MGGIGLLVHRWLLTRDAETGRRLGLPAPPVSLSDPVLSVDSEGPGLVRGAVPGLRPTMARKTDKKLMTSVSLLLAKPQVTGFGKRQVE
jgi:hypothetical protein